MIVTKKLIKEKILEYLSLKISLKILDEWCEEQFQSSNFDVLTEVLSKIGVSNVKNFSIEWHEWNYFLEKLGYKVEINLRAV